MIDLINGGNSQGEVADYIKAKGSLQINKKRPYLGEDGIPLITVLKKGGNPKEPTDYMAVPAINLGMAINTDYTLRPEEWMELDQTLVDLQQEEITGFDYVASKVSKRLNNPMGTTEVKWHSISDSQEAIMTMDGVVRGEGDASHYKENIIPIPIIHADYEINFRKLESSRRLGESIDVTEAAHAGRAVRKYKEDLLFGSGSAYTFGGGSIYGFLNFAHRNQVTLTKAWTDGTKTAAEILTDVKNLRAANYADNFRGPQTLFIPSVWDDVLDNDYDVSGASIMSIRQRILQLANIAAIVSVPRLADDNAVLVQLTTNVVDILTGLDMQNVQWQTEGGMVSKFKVMEIAIPRLKADYDGKAGIAHLA